MNKRIVVVGILVSALASDDKNEQKIREVFQNAVEIRYLVVQRPVSYVKPVIMLGSKSSEPNTYVAGEIVSVVYVIDLTENSIRSTFRVSGKNSATIEYWKSENGQAEANRSLIRNLHDVMELTIVSAARGQEPIKF